MKEAFRACEHPLMNDIVPAPYGQVRALITVTPQKAQATLVGASARPHDRRDQP